MSPSTSPQSTGQQPSRDPIIAIDGPAGAGKSTVARAAAATLGFVYLDTGALYRAIGVTAQQAGIDLSDPVAMGAHCAQLPLDIAATSTGATQVFVAGTDISTTLRTQQAGKLASQVAAHGPVRDALLTLQRSLGRDGGVVLDGRDIGTVVFPDAEIKIYLDAAPEARAERRRQDLIDRGETPPPLADVLAEVNARDAADRNRAVAPLRMATDAVRLDTTHMAPDAVIAWIVDRVRGAQPPG